jgi:hypothetical protein
MLDLGLNPGGGNLASETASLAYDGTLLPVGSALYGNELIVNGGFDSADGWVTSGSWAVGNGLATTTGTTLGYIKRNDILVIGKTYSVTFTIVSVSNWVVSPSSKSYNTIGTYTEIFTSGSTTLRFDTQVDTHTCSIDNVSVKEVLINPNQRYLKDKGKDKVNLPVYSGQGKKFNGTNQYVNTASIPNQAEGTLVTRFTYVTGMVSRCIIGSSELSLWVNASGKLEALFGNAVLTSTDVLVNNQSYHVSLDWLSLNAELKVDYVAKATATTTPFTTTLPLAIGARLTAITPTLDRYFNSIIDETYLYDVALPDTAIQALCLYPEKIKSYNGAIVPDIGYEANCKLFLPMSESSGTNVANVAVARGSEKSLDVGFDDASKWRLFDGAEQQSTISNGVLHFKGDGSGSCAINDSGLFSSKVGETYLYELEVTEYTSGGILVGINNSYPGNPPIQAVGKYYFILKEGISFDQSSVRIKRNSYPYDMKISLLSVRKISAFPIVNPSTDNFNLAKQLGYGAQCIAWKRDALGLPLDMSGGLAFDGGVSVKPINTSYIPLPSEDWVIETIMYFNYATTKAQTNGTQSTGSFQIGNAGSNGTAEVVCGEGRSPVVDTGYHHVTANFNTDTKTFNMTIDGVIIYSNVNASAYGIPTIPYHIGAVAQGLSTFVSLGKTIQGSNKIHKGAQYAKFDITKSWKAAQKIIAKLGA